jgi:galactonate dehydratase
LTAEANRQSAAERKRARLAQHTAHPAARSAKPLAAISDVKVWPVQQPHDRRAYVIVQVRTDAGLTGWGESAARPDLGAAVGVIEAHRRHLIGLDATAAESVRLALDGLGKGAGRDTAGLKAAVNMALMDILGKLAKAPAYEVLGGPTRNKVRALAPLHGATEAQLMDSLRRAVQAGFRAAAAPLPAPAGPARGPSFYRSVRRLLERLREVGGEQVDFVLDCGGRLKPAEAHGLARELEPFHLLWMDEPSSRVQQGALAGVSAESVTPIGLGCEIVENSVFQDLLRLDAVDVLRPDIARCGITQIRKAAALAETYYVALAPCHRGGPVGTAAALHVAASTANFFIQEIPHPADDRDAAMRRDLAGAELESVKDGFLSLPRDPGLGVTLDEHLLENCRAKT